VLATTDRIDAVVHLAADSTDLDKLARSLLTALLQPEVLQLRRLVIANADRFPDLATTWYERGFERVLATLATTFQHLADHGALRFDDPLQAAHHFTGLLLWIPINKAMFTGGNRYTDPELDHYAKAAVDAFLAAYRPRAH
jgi:TetR/AcrR family transcriptional repressor of mexJK operon